MSFVSNIEFNTDGDVDVDVDVDMLCYVIAEPLKCLIHTNELCVGNLAETLYLCVHFLIRCFYFSDIVCLNEGTKRRRTTTSI